MPEVTVAVPTFRRPQSLERLLTELAKLRTDAKVTVLVADNDCERREGFAVCTRAREGGYRWPLRVTIAPERGIANVRNALVREALKLPGAFIAMLDDDEWPESHWLSEFLRVQEQTGADALHGAVLREFDAPPGRWVQYCEGLSPWRCSTGPVDLIPSTSNVLIHRRCFEEMAEPWFDPAFALGGGEDTDFFLRLKMRGLRFAWADGAVVHAHVPQSRANLGWALKRAYSVGNSDIRVFLKHRTGPGGALREIAKIGLALLLFPFALAILAFVPNRRAVALCKLARAAGKVTALLGRRYDEYATTHGA